MLDPLSLGLVLGCLVLSAWCAGCEGGLYTVDRLRLMRLVREGNHRARLIQQILLHPEAALAALLVGHNLSVYLATVGFERLLLRRGAGGPEGGMVFWSTLVLTPIFFILGDLLPKDGFRRHPRTWIFSQALFLSRFTAWLSPVTRNLVRVGGWISARAHLPEKDYFSHLRQEHLAVYFREGIRTGAISGEQGRLLGGVMAADYTVGELMLPLDRVVMLDREAPPDEWRKTVKQFGYSYYPVYHGSRSSIVGIKAAWEIPDVPEGESSPFALPLVRVPGKNSPVRALTELMERGSKVGMVTDGQGDIIGMVTVRGLLEKWLWGGSGKV